MLVKCRSCQAPHWRGDKCLACAESRDQIIHSRALPITAMTQHGFHDLTHVSAR
jgi:hypothetical protein